MSKVILIYGSTTGNTETVSERVKGHLEEAGHEVDMKNVLEASASDLNGPEVIIMASSTWNDGELQDDFVPFHLELEASPPDLSGKKGAAFGCGESVYEQFCTAVNTLEKSLADWGAEILLPGLKVDGYPDEEENIQQIDDWSQKLLESLK